MKVEINKRDGSVEEMEMDEFIRWMCLVEALHFIEQKANDLGMNIEGLLKPIAIDEYIISRFPCMKHDVGGEIKLGLL